MYISRIRRQHRIKRIQKNYIRWCKDCVTIKVRFKLKLKNIYFSQTKNIKILTLNLHCNK